MSGRVMVYDTMIIYICVYIYIYMGFLYYELLLQSGGVYDNRFPKP